MRAVHALPAAVFVTLLTACAAGPNYHTPRLPVPQQYAETAAGKA
jgi:hypothetical protein